MMRCSIVALIAVFCVPHASFAEVQMGLLGKKLIEYGWDVPTPKEMRDNLTAMEKRPFDGIIYKLAGGYNAFVRKPLDPSSFTEDEHILRALQFKRFKNNFVLIWGTAEEGWDWFDDDLWRTVESNARILARAGHAAGGRGICFDPEPYAFNPWEYAKQAQVARHSFDDYRRKMRERGASFMRALEKEVPSPIVLTFFHVSLVSRLFDQPDPIVLDQLLRADRWGLMPDFLIGMLAGASNRARFVDGNEVSYYYTGSEPFFRAYHSIHKRALNLVPPELQEKYRKQVQAGQALYVDHLFALRQPNPQNYLSFRLSPEERVKWFEHNAYYALYTTDEYVWCYSERMNWWKNQTPPGLEEALLSAREKISKGLSLGFKIEPLLAEAEKRPVTPNPP